MLGLALSLGEVYNIKQLRRMQSIYNIRSDLAMSKDRNPFNIHEVMSNVFDENTTVMSKDSFIGNVCMIRSVSKNNRYYTPEALDSLVGLGKRGGPIKAFIDHDTMFAGQSVLNLLGEFSNLRRENDAVYADLTVYESSKGKDLLFDIATNHPHAAGFSINARGKFEEEPDNQGREVVKEIVAIRSCDFVGEPATTFGVFEQEDILAQAQAELDTLPDSCFAWVESGGTSFEDGRTSPRSLRHLPYKTKDGKVDLTKLKLAIAKIDEVKNMPKETKEAVLDKLNYILENGDESAVSEISGSKGPEGEKSNKKLQSSKGGETMDNIKKFLESRIQGWSGLKEEAQEVAALEYLNSLIEKTDEIPELTNVIEKLEESKKTLETKVEEVSSQLVESQAKVDAYETRDREAEATKTRSELIAKITKEEELADEHISETFKAILMSVAEGEEAEAQIRDLVKDRKSLLKAPEGGVTDMGHESTTEESTKEDDEKKKESFFEDLKRGL